MKSRLSFVCAYAFVLCVRVHFLVWCVQFCFMCVQLFIVRVSVCNLFVLFDYAICFVLCAFVDLCVCNYLVYTCALVLCIRVHLFCVRVCN